MKSNDTPTRAAPIFVTPLFGLAGLLALLELEELVPELVEAVFVPVGTEVT